jgi:hypothetical protein
MASMMLSTVMLMAAIYGKKLPVSTEASQVGEKFPRAAGAARLYIEGCF